MLGMNQSQLPLIISTSPCPTQRNFSPVPLFSFNITQLKRLPFTLPLGQAPHLELLSFLYSHSLKLSHGNCSLPPCLCASIFCQPGLGTHIISSSDFPASPTNPSSCLEQLSDHVTSQACQLGSPALWSLSHQLFCTLISFSICSWMLPLLKTFSNKA